MGEYISKSKIGKTNRKECRLAVGKRTDTSALNKTKLIDRNGLLTELKDAIDHIEETQFKIDKSKKQSKLKNNRKYKQKALKDHIMHMKTVRHFILERNLSPIDAMEVHLRAQSGSEN